MSPPLDIDKLRRDTPACEDVIHLDHAGSSLPPRPVLNAVLRHIDREARVGGYRAHDEAKEAIEATYHDIAALVGAQPDEIALVDSATRAWQLAFSAVRLTPGDRVICSRTEYASNHLAFLQRREHVAIDIVPIGPDESGAIDLGALEQELDRGAALVALTHVPTNGGLVHPAGEVGRLCRERDVPLLLDACQSAGQVDLRNVSWDMLGATGRKYLRGPRGTGFLAVRRAWLDRLESPLLDLHGATWTGPDSYTMRDDARRFELWEKNYADVLGLGAAVRYALDCGIEALEARIAAIADQLRDRLTALPAATVHDLGRIRCGLVTFTLDGLDAPDIKAALRKQDIHVNVSGRTSTLLDMDDRHLDKLVRASVHALTTEDELDRLLTRLDELTK